MGEGTGASRRWQVKDGKADEFIQRWSDWLQRTSQNIQGFRSARLLRAEDDPLRFTSVYRDVNALLTRNDFRGARQRLDQAGIGTKPTPKASAAAVPTMKPRDSIPATFVTSPRKGSTRASAISRKRSASSKRRQTSAWPSTKLISTLSRSHS